MSDNLKQRKHKKKERSSVPQETPIPPVASTVSNTQTTPDRPPLPGLTKQRIWGRAVMVIGVMVVVYFSARGKEVSLALQKDHVDNKAQELKCSDDYKKELLKFPGCSPQRCGRAISDTVVSAKEVTKLLSIAKKGLALGITDGSASILDLHSGALSYGDKFINIYKLPDAQNVFQPEDFAVYKAVKNKILVTISQYFGVDFQKLHLTHPTFFSRLTNKDPKTVHDEYWHPHVDKETYGTFHYTSLVYLNDYSKDFRGGRFVFVDQDQTNRTVEPRKGRVSMFTSGSENVHYVERVTEGTRYALTVSFTCDKRNAVADPGTNTSS